MSDSDVLAAVFQLNPRTGARAQRLALAVKLLSDGLCRRDVTMQIRVRFGVGQAVAWRVVDMAADMACLGAKK